MKQHFQRGAALLAALVASATVVACGGGGETGTETGSSVETDGGQSPAGRVVSGDFEAVATAPARYAGLNGEARLERKGGGTSVSVSLSGLQPGASYEAHLHRLGCEGTQPGGPHFKFDPTGSDMPPNEIHLVFEADGSGKAKKATSSQREVPIGAAGSVVVHLADDSHGRHAAVPSAEPRALLVHGGNDDNPSGDDGHDDHGGGDDDAPQPIACAQLEGAAAAAETTIRVENGEPVGGIQRLEFTAGEQISFRVVSDVADEVHVHGYDLMEDVAAGGSADFSFPADIEGIFEVELEGRGEQIAELRVNP